MKGILKKAQNLYFLWNTSLSAGDHSTVVSHSAGLSPELDNEHPQVSYHVLRSRQGTAGSGLFSFKWINFYLDNLGSNIYPVMNVLVIKKGAINFLVTGKGFCNLERNILFNIIKFFTTPCIIFEDLRARWTDKHL